MVAEGEGFLVVTDGAHKLVRIRRPRSRLHDGPEDYIELFDLAVDPEERIDVSGDPEYAEPLIRLQRAALDLLLMHALP